MSEAIKHECGIALIRLLKPLSFYQQKYGTSFYGIHKLYLLMEKQNNRGQDGAGIVNIKFDVEPGNRYISRFRSNASQPLAEIIEHINGKLEGVSQQHPEMMNDVEWLKKNVAFTGELFLGHLRYGTFGKNSIESCHPFLRQNNWMTKNLVVAGNFNLTNVNELFDILVELGQHPKEKADTVTIMEKIGHFLDEENGRLFKQFKSEGHSNKEISRLIADNLDIQRILTRATRDFDGGYVMAGLMGHGDAFVLRDPHGIRPAYYYQDDEVLVVASERPAIQTAFNVTVGSIKEINPGHALVIKKNGNISQQMIQTPLERKSCSFERIYFSRGSDEDIYKERNKLGELVCPAILKAIDFDMKNTVFSFIPSTAEVAYYGMVKGMKMYLDAYKKKAILNAGASLTDEQLTEILSLHPRAEKIAIKNAKLRTFITADSQRDEMVAHVYDTNYGIIRPGVDTLVIIDDSIVRGTTLKKSILKIIDRLGPKKIIVVSSAPQIRYPDCYGIDMAKIGDFVAFKAAIALLKETNQSHIIDEVYEKCVQQQSLPKEEVINNVKQIYKPFSAVQIANKIAEMIRPESINAEVEMIFQTIEDLHLACPNNLGDWYFSGDYPTPGGNTVVNKAFMNFVEGKNVRAY